MRRILSLGTKSILTAALAIFAANGALAQAVATVHGHVVNPLGQALKTGNVKMTTDKTSEAKNRVYKYTFPIDGDGNYKGANIAPGEYLAVIIDGEKMVDYQNITIKGGDDKALDFDMTRAEYLKAMSPADRAALEEYKKKNAAVAGDNAKIADLNKALNEAAADETAGRPDDAVKLLQDLPALRPTEPIVWAALAQAQLAAGDLALKTARTNKTSLTDPAIVDKMAAAAASYQKAIDNVPNNKKLSPEAVANYYNNMGNALSRSGKLPEAAAAYEASATTFPAKAASAYFNESVVYYQAGGKNKEAAAAADKAIAADPKRADAYYIKAQALIPGATTDKSGKYVLPPGCLEAYQEYLELDPNGSHATEIKEVLVGLGQPVKNTFKAGKK